jgi:hypothetical protein
MPSRSSSMLASSFSVVAVAVLLACGAAARPGAGPDGVGDRLVRSYASYVTVPTTAAAALKDGWVASNGTKCTAGLGVPYTYKGPKVTEDAPLTLYFTPYGQAASIQVNVWGEEKQNLIEKGFWRPANEGKYFLVASFRSSTDACSASKLPQTLGDRVVLNTDTSKAFHIPLTVAEAEAKNFHKGSCFWGMGTHYMLDLATGPKMTWESANLLPVIPMYDIYNGTGSLNAIFFASTSVQQGFLNAHWWDSVPLPDFAMCKNLCDKDCTWHDTSFWSTMHLYMNDYNKVTCPNDCTLACCPT